MKRKSCSSIAHLYIHFLMSRNDGFSVQTIAATIAIEHYEVEQDLEEVASAVDEVLVTSDHDDDSESGIKTPPELDD